MRDEEHVLFPQRGPDAGTTQAEREKVAEKLGKLPNEPDSEAEAMKKRTLDMEIMAKIKGGFVRDIVRENGDEMQRMQREMQKKNR